jgi:predicted transcriptional regulator
MTRSIHLLIGLLGHLWVGNAMLSLEQRPQEIGNRTRIEILASILKVASNGSLKTHIMYKANLSHRQLERYLTFLEERGLLIQRHDDEIGSRMYHVTNRGVDFLREYSHISGFISGKLA